MPCDKKTLRGAGFGQYLKMTQQLSTTISNPSWATKALKENVFQSGPYAIFKPESSIKIPS